MTKISVLIDNFNYAEHVAEAIRSVLAQDYPDFELIVVDDGSTDDSLEAIAAFHDDRLKVIAKLNGGQLSAFNAGFPAARGDVICFLDADDLYPPGYLAAVAKNFAEHPECGCFLATVEYFGLRSGTAPDQPCGFIGCAPFSVASRHLWRGAPTSAISLRREVAAAILPCTDNEKFWRTRADDLLVWGAELVGAAKYRFATPAVKYRVHGGNHFYGTDTPRGEAESRREAADRFCRWVMAKNRLSFSHLLAVENSRENTSFLCRFRGWLRIGRRRMVSVSEWLKCGFALFGGSLNGSSRRRR